jgi:hypothetical protein
VLLAGCQHEDRVIVEHRVVVEERAVPELQPPTPPDPLSYRSEPPPVDVETVPPTPPQPRPADRP